MNKALFVIFLLSVIGCKTNCDADCSSFNFNLAIYDWYLFPSNEQELKFYDDENNLITLEQTYNWITEARIIEHNCSNIFAPNDCNELITASYEFDQIEITSDIFDQEEDSFDEDYIKTGLEILLNSSHDIFIVFYYDENDQLKNRTNDEYDFETINFEVLNDIVLNNKSFQNIIEITVTNAFKESFNYDGITKIWIQKNNGLIAFELEGIVWLR